MGQVQGRERTGQQHTLQLSLGMIATVVGYDEEAKKWLVCVVFFLVLPCLSCVCLINLLSCPVKVRNTMMAKKRQPNRVEEAFMSRCLTLTLTPSLSLSVYLCLSLSLSLTLRQRLLRRQICALRW